MKRKNILTTIAVGTGVVAASASIGYYALSEHLYRKLICRKTNETIIRNPQANDDLYFYTDLAEEISMWLEEVERENVYISSYDGLELAGEWYHPDDESDRWILLGRANDLNEYELQNIAMAFYDRGYHVLIADARGYGKSEGNYISYGWHDRLDIQSWLTFILAQNAEAKIALYGISLSASSMLMAAGEPLPEQVRCVISDSGFTSAYDYMIDQLKQTYGLRLSFTLEGLDALTRLRAKYSLKNCNAVMSLINADIPIMFIHGEEDEDIPLQHVFHLHRAHTAAKELYTVPYAGHGEAMFSPRYFERIQHFLQEYIDS